MFKNIIIGGCGPDRWAEIGRLLVYIVLPLDGLERQAVGFLVHRSERGWNGSVWGSSIYDTRYYSHQMIEQRKLCKVRQWSGSTVTQ